ncbi:MAG: glycosyltransferase family 4 protein [Anaerolineae bacterium]
MPIKLDRPIRVLYINHSSIIGGIEVNLLDILRFSAEGGFRPVGVVLPGAGPLVARVQQVGVPVYYASYHAFRWRNPLHYLRTLATLVHCVLHTRAEVIHLTHHWLAEFAVQAGRLTRRPVVCEVQNLLDAYTLVQFRYWLARADAVVAVSQAVYDRLIGGEVPISKMYLISHGLHLSTMTRKPVDGHVLRDQFGIPRESPLAGVVGRLVPEKGVEDFIQAAARVASRLPGAYFVIVGEDECAGAYRAHLVEQAKDLGLDNRVIFTGFRTDVPDVLQDLDVLVLPSRSSMPEGLPLAVLEALAVGRIVVATRNSGVPEVVQDGVNGFLVDCDDVPGLAAAMERALNLSSEKRRRMEEAARATVADRTIERQMRELGQLYRELCQRRGSYPLMQGETKRQR